MRILIIGKSGQLGLSLCAEMKRNHIDYVATDRQELDVTDQKSVGEFFLRYHNFNLIVNAAAYTDVDGAQIHSADAHKANCCAVEYMARSAKELDIPLIHVSTDYVFDGKKNSAYDETDCTNPINIYGKTKLDGENVLKMIWKKHIILRISWVFSEYGKNFLKTIVQQYDKKESFSVVCDQFGSPTSARSVSRVILHISRILYMEPNREDYFGVYHYTDFPSTNWHQFAHYIAMTKEEKTGFIKTIYPIESKDYPTIAKRPKNSILNINKIKAVFGIKQSLWVTEVDRILEIL